MFAEPLLAVLIGPGGVGKGTLANALLDADTRLWLSRSWTTRPMRASERGDEYHFVTREEFEEAIDADRFVEWAEFHGNLYGTPRPADLGDVDVLLEIEVQGAEQVRREHPDAVIFLILPPSMEQLEERLRGRGDHDDHVERRLRSTPDEVKRGQDLADHVIVNDDLTRARDEILSILERLRRTRRDRLAKD